jgi:hypothetical protein
MTHKPLLKLACFHLPCTRTGTGKSFVKGQIYFNLCKLLLKLLNSAGCSIKAVTNKQMNSDFIGSESDLAHELKFSKPNPELNPILFFVVLQIGTQRLVHAK